jgi:TP901 family phage tail tape measure protein
MDESINVPVIPQVVPNAIRQAEAEISRLARDRNFNINATINNADLDKNIGRSLGRITGQADEFTKSMNAANARVLAFGASVGTINLIVKGFQGLISSAIEVESAVKKISISGNETFSDLASVQKGLFDISKYTATSFKDAAAAVLEFSRQGKNLKDSLTAARAALVLTRNTGLDAAEAVRGLTAVVNVFNQKGLDYEAIVNKMASVDTKFAVSSKDLIEGINRSASVAQEAKVSFEELTALITILQEKTGRGGPVIGNSLKTIFTRVQNPEILKDLKNLGILVTDTNQEFLSATQILVNLAEGYSKLDNNLKKSVLLKVGGGFQVDKLAALFDSLKGAGVGKDLTQFEKILGVASSKDNSAAFRKTEEQAKTFEGRLTKLNLAGKELSNTISEVGFKKNVNNKLDIFSSILESANKNISGGEKAGGSIGEAIVKGIGAALTGPGALIFGGLFIKFTLDFAKFAFSAVQSLTGITKKTKEEESIQQNLFGVLTRNKGIHETLLALEGNKAEQAKYIVTLYSKAANELERAAKWSKEIAPIAVQAGISTSSGTLVNKNTSRSTASGAGSLAKGYIPNFTSESQAYQNEVANAPAGAKIIRHTNFPLGGGKVAPVMYTNDKETLIPNFKGTGGTAVIPSYKTSSNGFIPNFAEASQRSSDKGTLNIDAMNFGIAGLSMGTDAGTKSSKYQGGLIGKTKGKELYTRDGKESSFLRALKGNPLYDAMKDYSKVQVSNLPVGAVYAFAKGVQDNEEIIKRDFIKRANSQISGSIATFILSELNNLGLSVPPTFANALKTNPQSFDLVDSSAAGGLFEKIVQYASLNGRSAASLKANEKTPFDIYGLSGKDAASFGLPEKSFRYVEVKSSIQELYDSITEKFVNQSKTELSAPKAGSAAEGYIPNFAEDPLKKSISREVKATGLPLSKIKVSKDPRLFSASKNPLSLAVTNTKDEPRGMSDVSSGRISEAYKNASNGYIPNFVRVARSQADKDFKKEMGYWPEQAPAPTGARREVDLTEMPAIPEPAAKTSITEDPIKIATEAAIKPTGRGGPGRGQGRRKGPKNPTEGLVSEESDATKNTFTGVDRGTMKDLQALSNILDQGGIELNEDVYSGADQPALSTSETRNYTEAGLTRRARAEQLAQSKLTPDEAQFRKEFLSNEISGANNELPEKDFDKLNKKYLEIARKYDDLVEKFETLDKENRLDEKQVLTGAKVPGVNVPFGKIQSGGSKGKSGGKKSGSKVGAGNVAASATENAQKTSGPKKTKSSSNAAAVGGGSGGGSGGGGNGGSSGSGASDDEGIPATEKSATASASESAQKAAASSRSRGSKSSNKASAGGGGTAGAGGGAGGGGGPLFSGGPIPVNVVAPKPLEVKIVASSIKFGETISDRMIKDVVDKALGERSAKQKTSGIKPGEKQFAFEAPPKRYAESEILSVKGLEKAKQEKEKEAEQKSKATAQAQAIAAAQKAAAEQSAREREASFAKARNPSLGEIALKPEFKPRVPRTFAELQSDIRFRNSLKDALPIKEASSQKYFNSLLGVDTTVLRPSPELVSAKDIEAEILKNTPRSRVSLSGISSPDYGKFKLNSVIPQKISPIPFASNGRKEDGVSKIEFSSLPASSLVDLATGNINPSATSIKPPRYLPPLSPGGAPRLNPNSDYEKSLRMIPENNLFSNLREKTEYVPPSLAPSAQSSKPKNSATVPNVGKSKLYPPSVDLSGYEKTQKINSRYAQKDPLNTSFDDVFRISADRQGMSKSYSSELDRTNLIFKPRLRERKDVTENFAPTEQQAADTKAFMQSVRDKIGTAVPQKSKLQLDSSLLTGEGLSGSKTIFRSLKPEQIEKLKKEIEFLTTQFQKNGKPMASLEEVTKMVSKRLRDFGVNIKPEGLRELATATNKSEKQRLEAVSNAQRTTANITYSVGTPMDMPDANSTRNIIRDRISSAQRGMSESIGSARNFGRSIIGNFAGQTEEEKQRKKDESSTDKSAVESVAALGKLLTITIGLNAAMSVFGERIAALSEGITSGINAFYTFKEGMNSANQLRGSVDVLRNGEVIGQRSRSFRETFDAALEARRNAMAGTGGVAATGALGQLQGARAFLSGGGLSLATSAVTATAVGVGAAVQAFNALDSVLKFVQTDAVKGAGELAKITELQKKYNTSLSEGARQLLSATNKTGEVDPLGAYGFLARRGIIPKLEDRPGEDVIKTKITNLRMQPAAQQAFYSSLNENSLVRAEEQQRKMFEARQGPFAKGGKVPDLEANGDKPQFKDYIDYQLLQETADLFINQFLDQRILEVKKEFDNFYLGLGKTKNPTTIRNIPIDKGGILDKDSSLLTPGQSTKAQESSVRSLGKLMKTESDEAYAKLKRSNAELGVSKEYLTTQLSIYTKIADAANNLTTEEEYRLQGNKENFSISEKQKDLDELRLKLIQNERQTRQEINSIVNSGITQEIQTKLQPFAFGVKDADFKKFTEGFKTISIDLPVDLKGNDLENELEKRLSTVFEKTLGLGIAGDPDVKRKILEQSKALLLDQVRASNLIGDSKANQLKLDYDSLRNIKARKYVEDSLRENLDARLTIQQKNLSLLKEERDIALSIKENQLRSSLVGNYNVTPRRAEMILREAAPEQQKARDESALKARRDESFSSLRKSVIDYTVKNNPGILEDTKKVNNLINTKSEADLLKSLEDAMKFQADQVDPLKSAADYFKDETKKTLSFLGLGIVDLVRQKGNSDLFKQTELTLNPSDASKGNSGLFKTTELNLNPSDVSTSKVNNAVPFANSGIDLRPLDITAASQAEKSAIQKAFEEKTTSEAIKNKTALQLESFGVKIPGNAQQDIDEKYRLNKLQTKRDNKLTSDFEGGLMSSKIQMDEEIEFFGNKMGREIPDSFRDSMASAMRELANPNSTEPLKNRLLGVASAFLQKINDSLMTNLANRITSPITGLFTPEMKASGGMITGGSGSKDDVPAMLMGGEYVINKKSVSKYGAGFLDSLNKGGIKKFANGGWVESDVTKYQDPSTVNPYGQIRDQGLSFNESGQVIGMDSYTGTAENKQNAMMRAQSDYYAKNAQSGQGGFYTPGENGMGAIMGQRNLLSFATQQTAGTRFDKISGAGGAGSIDLGAGSSNMSLFALRDQENSRNAGYLESKRKSLDLYFGGIDAAKEKANREEEIKKEQERIKEEAKKQEKAMIKGILTSIATSAAMAGVSALGNAASAGWSATNQASNGTATFGDKFKGAFTGGTMGGETRGGISNMFSSSGYKDFSVIGSNTGQGLYQWDKKGGYYNEMSPTTFGGKYGTASDASTLKYDKLGTPYVSNRRAAGGYVAGNGMGDNVPTMLNGGEFVVSKQAAQNIGANKLQQINSGKTGGDSSEMIAAKLDELVEKLSAVGTLNITVNSDSKGGQQSKEEGGNQDKETKELARRIKEVVMVVLKEEKRLGGMLR